MNRTNRRILVGILGAFFFAGLLIFCTVRDVPLLTKGAVEYDSGCRFIMGTVGRIVCVASDANMAEGCVKSAFEQLEKVEELMSVHNSNSEISRVNRDAYKNPVRVSQMTFEVLAKSIEFSGLTAGAFDVTIGPLVELWDLADKGRRAPGQKLLEMDMSKVGYKKLVLNDKERTVRFTVNGMKLDLGGIAKGFAIDKAVETMKNKGAIGGMIDIGGDIRCFGRPAGRKRHWLIGLQDPGKVKVGFETGEPLILLKILNSAVTTSGGYRRFAVIDGKKYSHIIDRRTGMGAEGLSSVTIIAESAADADALATAVSVMGTNKGMALVNNLRAVEAILVTAGPKYDVMYSNGAQEFVYGRAKKLKENKDKRTEQEMTGGKMTYRYEVQRAKGQVELNGNWDGEIWGDVEAIELNNYMGDKPKHQPKTQVKLLYDDEFIYVIFRVADEFVRAVAKGFHGRVWEDSCVEFFFVPGQDTAGGYFNLETNCGGTMLFNFQRKPRVDSVKVADEDCRKVKIYHSQHKIVEPEKQGPTVWFIEYRLPLEILENYCKVDRPAPGVVWRANFYKCGDKTSRPHWLTWSKVDLPEPDFHQPAFFGTLEFK